MWHNCLAALTPSRSMKLMSRRTSAGAGVDLRSRGYCHVGHAVVYRTGGQFVVVQGGFRISRAPSNCFKSNLDYIC